MKLSRIAVLLLFTLLALLPTANAQTTSGTITGDLADPGGAAIVGANVQLISDVSKQVREFKTDSSGGFQFQVPPGAYTLHVAQTGFKALDQKVNVAPAERFDTHTIRLELGDVATTVEVQGEIAHVQTDSSDRSITINTTQIEDTPSAGRNYLNILRSLPGTATTTTTDARGGTGANGGGGAPAVNGGAGQLLVTLDGIASQDSGAPGTGGYIAPSIDAIGEVQLMVSNYTAEYGARNGGQMNVTIKNGTNQFHGTAYYYYRHEEFNANEFFNNKNTVTINGIPGQATPKALYRYSEPGGTIGGPFFIPKVFNRDKNKVFFFFSADFLHHKGTNGPNRYVMPTAAERGGDFSKTYDTKGVLIPIKNPLAGGAQFAGNIIPASQINSTGYALLNLFPLPNDLIPATIGGVSYANDPTRGYNYTDYFTNSSPIEDKILRVDFNAGKKTQIYVRGLSNYYATIGAGSLLQASGAGWGQFLSTYGVPSAAIAANAIHTFRPNLINEFTWGINRSHQIVGPNDESACTSGIQSIGTGNALPYTCSQLSNPNLKGPAGQPTSFPNFYPGANYLNLLPNVNFGSGGGFSVQQAGAGIPTVNNVSSTPGFGYDSRWPFNGTDQISSITDNVTWIKGAHTIKGGFYFEYDSRNVSVYSTYNTAGTFYFAPDTANPNDTNYAFSNALTGASFAYGTDNKKQINHARYATYEFFIQDTWKVNRRLTLDLGLRVQSIGQEYSSGASLGLFAQSAFNSAKVGQLLFPALDATGKKIARNPVTGVVYPFAQAGTFDPLSYASGTYPWSGTVTYQDQFWHRGTPNIGPRIGFAYDVLGNGKMAVRGGFGIFYGRATSVDNIAAQGAGNGPIAVAPNFLAPAYAYPTFAGLAASTAYYAPQAVLGGTQDILNPQTLQWSFGVQRDIGKGVIMDVSYLGWVNHHGFSLSGWDFNNVAPYTTWKPVPDATTNSCGMVTRFLDPTGSAVNPGGTTPCSGGAFLNSNLIRAMQGYPGWTSIGVSTNAGESNYNALQVQINKRFGKSLQFGTNYNWSKQLQYSRSQDIPDVLTYNVASGNRPQVVNVNFGYRVPDGTKFIPKNAVTSGIVDGWNINGVMSFYNGTPMTIGCSAGGTGGSAPIGYWTGTPVNAPGMRCQMQGSLWLPDGATPASVGSTADPRLWYPFNAGPSVNMANAGFTLPSATSLGIGNTPPTLTYGPGFMNADIAVYKDFRLGKETRVLQLKAETFNTLNHFNPGNPATSLQYNFYTGVQQTAGFGQITSANGNSRRMALSLRLRF
jgi:hypothetical protein